MSSLTEEESASTDLFSAFDKKSEPGDTISEPGVNRVGLCNPSYEGVPRRVFIALYQSFSQLNAKLASKVEIKMSSTCSDPVPPFDSEAPSGARSPASESSHLLDLISFDDGLCGSLEQTEDQGLSVAAADRCCMCLTVASDEELMTTPCCLRAVGSICFEEGLQDNGTCCLCKEHPYNSNLQSSGEPSDGATDYKVHFVPASQTEEQVGHLTTVSHRFKLLDRDVIHHVKGVDEESLLDLVYSAFRERVHRTACKGFFQRAQVLDRRYIGLSICLTCSQDPDLMTGLKNGSSVFESFVLTTQLRRYQVTLYHIQIGTMSIVRGVDKSKTIKILLEKNASVLKSFQKPVDIRAIYWTQSIGDLRPLDYAAITVTFSTAQQANEAILLVRSSLERRAP